MQAKGLTQFANMKTADLDKEALEQFCTPMKNAPKETQDLVARCHPDVLKKAAVMCSDKGDDKDNEEDDKGDEKDNKEGDKGDDKDNKEGDKGDDKDDKGDGKGDTNDDKSDDKDTMCAVIAPAVCSRCVHAQIAGK